MSDDRWIGFNDEPATEDSIGAQPYIQGFVNFITQCPTPMTTAIQGDWGTGKTSALRAIKKALGDDAWVIEFNTWQYSQFNLGEQLVFSLIGEILTQLIKMIDQSRKKMRKPLSKSLKEKLFIAISTALPLVEFGAKLAGIGGVVEALRNARAKYKGHLKKNADFGVDNLITSISALRSRLQDLVDAITEEHGPERIYIFIDDLDRLEPERAVEVMEALKVFLSLRNCVFVLAIDFSVVLQGVRSKYGTDFSEDKARSFFDKIIQIPFNLPVRAYQIRPMLEEGLRTRLHITASDKTLSNYVDLVTYSIGNNPRSIKRILNTFALILEISKTRNAENSSDIAGSPSVSLNEQQQLDVFALLCLQTGYQRLFVSLIRNVANSGSAKSFLNHMSSLARSGRTGIVNTGDTENPHLRKSLEPWGLQPVEAPILENFLDVVVKIFSDDKGRNLDDYRIQTALSNAAITAVGLGRESDDIGTGRRINTPLSLESRLENLRKRGIDDSTRNKMIAFDNQLNDELDAVLARNTERYWGYVIGKCGKPNEEFGLAAFAELHYYNGSSFVISVKFGKHLSDENKKKVMNEVDAIGLTINEVTSEPPLIMRGIGSPDAARQAARIVAHAYQLAGQ